MSAEYPTLAEVLASHLTIDGYTLACDVCNYRYAARSEWSAHAEQAWHEACTVRSVDQLDALPPGSLVKFADGSADQRGLEGDGEWSWSRASLEDLLSVGAALLIWHPSWSQP